MIRVYSWFYVDSYWFQTFVLFSFNSLLMNSFYIVILKLWEEHKHLILKKKKKKL